MSNERPFARAVQRLQDVGLRPTRQRLGLAKLLFDEGDRHVTAEQLHGEAMGDNLKVSLATVYNTLNQFTEAGLLREVVVESSRSYFDTNTSEHHHFFHERDGMLEDIPCDHVILTRVPEPPKGKRVARVEVIVRLADEV